MKNADDIASVDGIDVLLIGSFDLTSELGIPGQMGHKKLIDAFQAVGDACRKHGKALGMGGINEDEDARRYIAMGSRFLSLGQRSQLHCVGLDRAGEILSRSGGGAGKAEPRARPTKRTLNAARGFLTGR